MKRLWRALHVLDRPDGWTWADERLQKMEDDARLAKQMAERGYTYRRINDHGLTADGRHWSRVIIPLAQGITLFIVGFIVVVILTSR